MSMQEVSSHNSSLFLTLFFFAYACFSLSGNDMMSALILVRSRPSFTLVYTSRQLRPSALFSFCPQKSGTQNAHASQSFGIGCSFGFGRSMPSASSSLASFIISYTCTYFVHNLYTKTKTATNHVSNLHPRCLYAGTQNTAKKSWRVNHSPLQPP